jgi:hypothetical protein
MIDGTVFVATLRTNGFEPFGFLAACTRGENCVALNEHDYWMAEHVVRGLDVGDPKRREAAWGTIVYWPDVAWPE